MAALPAGSTTRILLHALLTKDFTATCSAFSFRTGSTSIEMAENKQKIAIAITGASGSIYAKVLLTKLQALSAQLQEVSVVMSDNAKDVWKHELGNSDYEKYPFKNYTKNDF